MRAGRDLPQPHRAVITPTCECISIRTERYAKDLSRMPGESAYGRAGVHLPQPHRAVETPTGKGVSIRTERYAKDLSRMPGESAYGARRSQLPTAAPSGPARPHHWQGCFHPD